MTRGFCPDPLCVGMCKSAEVILMQLVCRLSECRASFHICRSCYRGQCYCSRRCRKTARRRQQKAANLRYYATPEARFDRSDRQRAWRERQKARVSGCPPKSVMYQGSKPPLVVSVSVCHGFFTRHAAVLDKKTMVRRSRCVICGRAGRLVNPFFTPRRHYP
jgi:hypothetical protein